MFLMLTCLLRKMHKNTIFNFYMKNIFSKTCFTLKLWKNQKIKGININKLCSKFEVDISIKELSVWFCLDELSKRKGFNCAFKSCRKDQIYELNTYERHHKIVRKVRKHVRNNRCSICTDNTFVENNKKIIILLLLLLFGAEVGKRKDTRKWNEV